MKLEVIVKALKWLEIDMDVDEVIFLNSLIAFYCLQLIPSKISEGRYVFLVIFCFMTCGAFAGRVYNGDTDI